MIYIEPLALHIFLRKLWHVFLNFIFYYPLGMSYAWMCFAILFFLQSEHKERYLIYPPGKQLDVPVSILIPCFNESKNVEESITNVLSVNYPAFEVIAIDDGSQDNTGAILDYLVGLHSNLRVLHLVENQGKALALQAGSLVSQHEILLCIDGDALLDSDAIPWIVRHFLSNPRIGAVTGNPRIRNRSTLIGRIQVGEFSSIIGLIKRAQCWFGQMFTVSGVISAFRKSALHQVSYWSPDMLTEDIDITWKLQRSNWKVIYEPHAIAWILMPETLQGLWKQRLRWAIGGAQVLLKNLDVFCHSEEQGLWFLMAELILTLSWAYSIIILLLLWIMNLTFWGSYIPDFDLPLLPESSGLLLGITCMIQFAVSLWLDSPYDSHLERNYYWMVWYPFAFWIIVVITTIIAFPMILMRHRGQRARWVSPDRGVRF